MIVARRLEKRYGEKLVLRGLDFELERGQLAVDERLVAEKADSGALRLDLERAGGGHGQSGAEA